MGNVFNPGVLAPGGGLVSGMGGFVVAGPLGPAARAMDIAAIPNANRIDVGEWRGRINYINDDTTHTGTWFEHETRCTLGFQLQLALPLDLLQVAQSKMQNGDGFQVWLKIGDKSLFYPDAVTGQKMYYSTRVLLSADETVNDAKKAVRYTAMAKGTGIFLLPDQVAACNAYLAYLASRGWDNQG